MKRRGNTLVMMLSAVGILMLLLVVFFVGQVGGVGAGPGKERADKMGTTVPGKVIFAARDEVCKSNLSQAREAVKIARMGAPDGKAPDTLEELHLGSSFTKCPIEPHEPYNYNPATGEVTCPHPGHGDY